MDVDCQKAATFVTDIDFVIFVKLTVYSWVTPLDSSPNREMQAKTYQKS
tara:strand:- start:23030 stop:23176 length:147 start_codon:yes stop_codon:yes gene_type:complete